jgi:hypothetical protein
VSKLHDASLSADIPLSGLNGAGRENSLGSDSTGGRESVFVLRIFVTGYGLFPQGCCRPTWFVSHAFVLSCPLNPSYDFCFPANDILSPSPSQRRRAPTPVESHGPFVTRNTSGMPFVVQFVFCAALFLAIPAGINIARGQYLSLFIADHPPELNFLAPTLQLPLVYSSHRVLALLLCSHGSLLCATCMSSDTERHP